MCDSARSADIQIQDLVRQITVVETCSKEGAPGIERLMLVNGQLYSSPPPSGAHEAEATGWGALEASIPKLICFCEHLLEASSSAVYRNKQLVGEVEGLYARVIHIRSSLSAMGISADQQEIRRGWMTTASLAVTVAQQIAHIEIDVDSIPGEGPFADLQRYLVEAHQDPWGVSFASMGEMQEHGDPLHVAILREDPRLMRLMLEAGADPTRTDGVAGWGRSPLQYLLIQPCKEWSQEMLALLGAGRRPIHVRRTELNGRSIIDTLIAPMVAEGYSSHVSDDAIGWLEWLGEIRLKGADRIGHRLMANASLLQRERASSLLKRMLEVYRFEPGDDQILSLVNFYTAQCYRPAGEDLEKELKCLAEVIAHLLESKDHALDDLTEGVASLSLDEAQPQTEPVGEQIARLLLDEHRFWTTPRSRHLLVAFARFLPQLSRSTQRRLYQCVFASTACWKGKDGHLMAESWLNRNALPMDQYAPLVMNLQKTVLEKSGCVHELAHLHTAICLRQHIQSENADEQLAQKVMLTCTAPNFWLLEGIDDLVADLVGKYSDESRLIGLLISQAAALKEADSSIRASRALKGVLARCDQNIEVHGAAQQLTRFEFWQRERPMERLQALLEALPRKTRRQLKGAMQNNWQRLVQIVDSPRSALLLLRTAEIWPDAFAKVTDEDLQVMVTRLSDPISWSEQEMAEMVRRALEHIQDPEMRKQAVVSVRRFRLRYLKDERTYQLGAHQTLSARRVLENIRKAGIPDLSNKSAVKIKNHWRRRRHLAALPQVETLLASAL